jgi:hypothetical protein
VGEQAEATAADRRLTVTLLATAGARQTRHMVKPDIQKYCDLMEEVKRRISVIDFFLFRQGHALYEPTTIESVALQIRKILELIAFGSLVANQEKYAEIHKSFERHWRTKNILEEIAKINPDFYPRPVVEIPLEGPGPKTKLEDRKPDYLSKQQFLDAYDQCSEIIQAANPYDSPTAYEDHKHKLPLWRNQIINLLNSHQIRLVNQLGFYLIHMKEEQDDKIHFYEFAPPH